jgi:hypothetical protein
MAKPDTLEELVKLYLAELANPSPDWSMRVLYRKWMAEKVGVPDPTESRRKWDEANKRRQS